MELKFYPCTLQLAQGRNSTKHKGTSNIITLVSKLGKEAWGAVSSERRVTNEEESHADFSCSLSLPALYEF